MSFLSSLPMKAVASWTETWLSLLVSALPNSVLKLESLRAQSLASFSACSLASFSAFSRAFCSSSSLFAVSLASLSASSFCLAACLSASLSCFSCCFWTALAMSFCCLSMVLCFGAFFFSSLLTRAFSILATFRACLISSLVLLLWSKWGSSSCPLWSWRSVLRDSSLILFSRVLVLQNLLAPSPLFRVYPFYAKCSSVGKSSSYTADKAGSSAKMVAIFIV